MKTNDSETVREVCAKMLEPSSTCRACDFTQCPMLVKFAAEVKEAHEREMAAKNAEIARLKEALKHILKAQMPSSGKFPYKTYSRKMRLHGLFDCDGGLIMATDGFGIASCVNAVLEAQRVIREGELAAHNRVAKKCMEVKGC